MTKLYQHYWGKAEHDPLKAAYCTGQLSKVEILEKFKQELAKGLNKPASQLQVDDLDTWAATEKPGKEPWQYQQQGYAAYHLLAYHCLDVAAVGVELLAQQPLLASRFEQLFGLPKPVLLPWLSVLLAVHDCGKFAESFQQLKPELRQHWWGAITKTSYDIRHDSLGFILWEDDSAIRKDIALESRFYRKSLKIWLQAVTGHHGMPPKNSKNGAKVLAKTYFKAFDIDSAAAFYQDLTPLFKPDPAALASYLQQDHFVQQQQSASWLLSGYSVLCDWLGSDTDSFKYCADESLSLSDYWHKHALPSAKLALQKAGILPAKVASKQSLPALFPYLNKPTPLQLAADSLVLPQCPQLLILEDVTGAGKTEAAVMLAHRLISQGLAQGFFFGLPTMATANAMYGRMGDCYQKLYTQHEKPSLILAHSARHLSEAFQQSIMGQTAKDRDYTRDDNTASIQCVRWFADHRKAALLADVGIGTIDQALLGVLPAKHQSLRLLGLANKVLVVDEVHAYDAYMNRLLQNLLHFHALLGGSAILLSATLPFAMREDFVAAFQKGAGFTPFKLQKNAPGDYPLLTHITDAEPVEKVLATRPEVQRTVKVAFVHDCAAVYELINLAVANKQCVCWIRNTVFDARTAYSELKNNAAFTGEALLFHSRYALNDRQTIEGQVLNLFGKTSTAAMRSGKVLCATQVVEQSLDLDFDVMISDLAPIDLLIQRAGRLHRHIRDSLGNPCTHAQQDQRLLPSLIIHAPVLDEQPAQDWYKAVFPKANGVYPHTGQLWRTAQLLAKKQAWRMPEDARELIEIVYRAEDGDIPEALKKASAEAEGEHWAKASMANMNALKPESGYTLSDNSWDEDQRIPTRLSEDSVTVYLAVWHEGQLSPLVRAKKYAWDLSSVNIKAQQLSGLAELSKDLAAALKQLRDQEQGFNDYSFILPMLPVSDTQWQGQAVDANGKAISLTYCCQQGMLLGAEIGQFAGG